MLNVCYATLTSGHDDDGRANVDRILAGDSSPAKADPKRVASDNRKAIQSFAVLGIRPGMVK